MQVPMCITHTYAKLFLYMCYSLHIRFQSLGCRISCLGVRKTNVATMFADFFVEGWVLILFCHCVQKTAQTFQKGVLYN